MRVIERMTVVFSTQVHVLRVRGKRKETARELLLAFREWLWKWPWKWLWFVRMGARRLLFVELFVVAAAVVVVVAVVTLVAVVGPVAVVPVLVHASSCAAKKQKKTMLGMTSKRTRTKTKRNEN